MKNAVGGGAECEDIGAAEGLAIEPKRSKPEEDGAKRFNHRGLMDERPGMRHQPISNLENQRCAQATDSCSRGIPFLGKGIRTLLLRMPTSWNSLYCSKGDGCPGCRLRAHSNPVA
jgi:hypothetical protein